jgi:hypothetical protein
VSLAPLGQRHGKREDAHRMLSTIDGWFTEGVDTTDLKEAKTLSEESADPPRSGWLAGLGRLKDG